MIDLEGSSVNFNDQMKSAINELKDEQQNLQGTLIVPHGSVPVSEYDNPSLWLGAYPWLFPYGNRGPEITKKVKVGLRSYMKHLLKLAD